MMSFCYEDGGGGDSPVEGVDARRMAGRSVLHRIDGSDDHSTTAARNDTAPLADPRSSRRGPAADGGRGLLPQIDEGLDAGHRFELLHGIMRPVKQFLRRTFDDEKNPDLGSSLSSRGVSSDRPE